jgi:hypothetical protein
MKMGITPKVRQGAKPCLFINEYLDLKLFQERISYTSPKQRERLAQLTAVAPSRRMYRYSDYLKAKELHETHGDWNSRQIAKTADIDERTLRSWRKSFDDPNSDAVPNEIKRIRALLSLLDTRIDEAKIRPLLFRECGLTVYQVNAAIRSRSTADIVAAVEEFSSNHDDPRTDPDFFFSYLMKYKRCELGNPFAHTSFNGGATQVPQQNATLTLSPERLDAPSPAKTFKRQHESGSFASLRYLEALENLVSRAPELNFPNFTYEKFVETLKPEEQRMARCLLIALSNEDIGQAYREFLNQEDLLPPEYGGAE